MSFTLTVPKKTVNLGDQAVEFRGLAFDDITMLMSKAPDDIQKVFELIKGNKEAGGIAEDAAGKMITSLVAKFPSLVCLTLAIAVGDPEAASEFVPAPMGFQLLALETVFSLTVEAAGGPKKFFELLLSVMASLNPETLMA